MEEKDNVTEKHEDLAYKGPSVNSSDPNERKLARRLRIQRRIEAIRKQRTRQEDTSETAEIKNAIQQQILRSYETLEKFITEGEEYISNVRVASDSRENDRREKEGVGREKTIKALEDEANLAEEEFAQIAGKWAVIIKYNDPLHIHDEIEAQKEKCDSLIKHKEEIISMLKLELKVAEENFGKDQLKQNEDISTLAQRIEKQMIFMRTNYAQELDNIETAILEERQTILDENNLKWEELYQERDIKEEQNCELKFEALEKFYNQMDNLRIQFQENYRAVKIKVENNIEALQKEMEKIKALTLVNTEKLDYNYQILRKREDENIKIKSQQKRRMNKLLDISVALKKEIADYTTVSRTSINKLSKNIKKLNDSIKEVETKADHFAKANDEKFQQILELNKNELIDLLNKIKSIDKILYEQQMGVTYNPFETNIRFYIYDIKKQNIQRNRHGPFNHLDSFTSLNSMDVINRKKIAIKGHEIAENKEDDLNKSVFCGLIKKVLSKIADQSGFLVEKKLMEILEPYSKNSQTIVRMDNALAALEVKHYMEIDILVQYFIPYTYCPYCSKSDRDSEGSEGTVKSQFSKKSAKSSKTALRKASKRSVHSNLMGQLELDADPNLVLGIRQTEVVINNSLIEMLKDDDEDQEVVIDEVPQNVIDVKVSVSEPQDTLIDVTKNAAGTGGGSKFETSEPNKIYTDEQIIELLHCEFNHPLEINPVYILKGLREFITAHYTAQHKENVSSIEERIKFKRQTVSRSLSEKEIKKYFEKYQSAFSRDRETVWNALLDGLKKYHQILKVGEALWATRALVAIEHPAEVFVISSCTYGQRAFLKFTTHTGATPIAGRFTPGAFTNQIQAAFREPRLLIVTDPAFDHQPITEASYVNIPVIAIGALVQRVLRNSVRSHPHRPKSPHLTVLRGKISRDSKWDVVVDLFFYRESEEAKKEEQAAKEAVAVTTKPEVTTHEPDIEWNYPEYTAEPVVPAIAAAAAAATATSFTDANTDEWHAQIPEEWTAGSTAAQGTNNWGQTGNWTS